MHIQMNSYHNKEKLILSNVSKSYNNTLVLEDINIKVNEGELVTILGPSGSGKSTIFNIITNLTQKDNGNVYIDGKISYNENIKSIDDLYNICDVDGDGEISASDASKILRYYAYKAAGNIIK